VAALLAALVVLVLGAAPAGAHADLSGTEPASGAVVAEAPDAVVLRFTEAVSVETDGVRILDASAERWDAGQATASGSVVTVPLRSGAPNGGYVVAWRVISADGHPINGAFQFSVGVRSAVGDDVAEQAFGADDDRRDAIAGAVLRSLAYLGVLVAAGVVAVGTALRSEGEPSPVRPWVAALAGVGAVALMLQVPVQTSRMTGRGWGSVTEAGVLGRALGDGFGLAIGISMLGLVLIAITAGLPYRGPVRVIALAGAVLAPLGLPLTGHTRTMSPAALGYAADLGHVFAGAVWFGGLVALLGVLRVRRSDDDPLGAGEAVARFSAVAGVSLAVVAATGAALSWITVGGVEALTGTTYGRLLMAKVALVALVAAGGAWNRVRLVPVLAAVGPTVDDAERVDDGGHNGGSADVEPVDESASEVVAGEVGPAEVAAPRDAQEGVPLDGVAAGRWRTLGLVLRVEVALLALAVAVTGVLVNVTPAEQAVATVITREAPFGEGTVEIWVDPGRTGSNDIHAVVLGADGTPDDTIEEAEIALALPAQDVGPIEATPVRVGPGHFQLVGADLTLPGEWTVTFIVRPDRFTLTDATVSFRIP
jgi:copper transport protein